MAADLTYPDAPEFVLASGSATRQRMLRAAGLRFAVETVPIDEAEIKLALQAEGVTALDAAVVLAEIKGERVASRLPGEFLVLGADQLLEVEGAWLDKPADRAAAARQLARLSGRTHRLFSAAVLFRNGSRIWHHVAKAELWMRRLSPEWIEDYLDAAGPEVLHAVGSYHLEGLGAQLFHKVEGDLFTVMGLPLLPLLQALRDQQFLRR